MDHKLVICAKLWNVSQEREAVDCWHQIVEKALDCCGFLRSFGLDHMLLRRLWIGSQESEAVDCFEGFGLDHKKVKLWIVEKTFDWITRTRSCGFLRRLSIGSQESEAVDC